MKTKLTLFAVALVGVIYIAAQFISCKIPEDIASKGGAQLWGENCSRCHNIPSPADFNDGQWTVIGKHMRVRANLTKTEVEKIIEFIKTAN